MIRNFFKWAGWPGTALVALLTVGVIGSVATVWVGAPMAAIPLLDFLALLLAPFPTLVCYVVVALLLYVALRLFVEAMTRQRRVSEWAAGILTLVIVTTLGIGLPRLLNAAAGLTAPPAQDAPSAVALPKGGSIALVENGDPRYARCNALCLSLLLQEQVHAVDVVETPREPAPRAVLPGRRYMLTAQTQKCLTGMRDYTVWRSSAKERHEDFVKLYFAPIEYDTCLDRHEITFDPSLQTTLVEWIGDSPPEQTNKPGFSDAVAVVRTVAPVNRQALQIHQTRYRAGWKYDEPLFIMPYAGNAGSGSYFSPSISISYFREAGFPDAFSPRFWRLLQDSEQLGQKTAALLDTLVTRRTRPQQ